MLPLVYQWLQGIPVARIVEIFKVFLSGHPVSASLTGYIGIKFIFILFLLQARLPGILKEKLGYDVSVYIQRLLVQQLPEFDPSFSSCNRQ